MKSHNRQEQDRKLVRGHWDGGKKDDGSCECGVVVKAVDKAVDKHNQQNCSAVESVHGYDCGKCKR